MMLKDDLFGLDFDGQQVAVGQYRSYGGDPTPNTKDDDPLTQNLKVHDIDSVCLDCHNPTIFNGTSTNNHTDTGGNTIYNDDMVLRGLP
jgi:hypothetical protein